MPRRVAPGKYAPLRAYLAAQPGPSVTLSPRAIERLLGAPLPDGAGSRWWWANTATTAQGRAWAAAGWRVTSIRLRLSQEAITFVRSAPPRDGDPARP